MSGLERYREGCIKRLKKIEFGEGSHENLSKVCGVFTTPNFGWSRNECESLRTLLVELIDTDTMLTYPLDADGVPIRFGDRVTRIYDDREEPLRVILIQYGKSGTEITAEVVGNSPVAYTVPSNELRHVMTDTPDAILDDLLSRWYDAATPEEEARLRAEAVRRIEALSD